MNKLPSREHDFAQWYQEVIYQAQLVDQSPVRGTMVVRPYGYALWENIVRILDNKIKETGHQNAAFPLFIPESFLKKEAQHVEGFAPELAVVTHAGGKPLEEPLVVRPTSETIIHYMFARWINSWRDLPLKINQWANVVRWEMRPRPFVRTTEFFWQEGHTAHETYDQAHQEALLMLDQYVDLAQNFLAIPVIAGTKSAQEKFPGAQITYTFEGIMADGKALQMGTSHLLSQSFAHAFDMKFQDREGNLAYPHLTSWGATTRLVGAVVMTHGDDKGLILPPRIAPIQVVIIPIIKTDADRENVIKQAYNIAGQLKDMGVRVHVDDDDQKTPGAKFYWWELKGVPVRIEIGPRDMAQQQVICAWRINGVKTTVSYDKLVSYITESLDTIQNELFARAQKQVKSHWHHGQKLSEFGPLLEQKNGVYQTGWCQEAACENKLKEYKASTRCLLQEHTATTCFNCDRPSVQDVLVAKSY